MPSLLALPLVPTRSEKLGFSGQMPESMMPMMMPSPASWEPPSRFVYLWHLRRDRADATEVEIRFIGRGETSTLVEIEHRGWEALGAEGESWRDRNNGGWATLLPHFVAAARASRGSPTTATPPPA